MVVKKLCNFIVYVNVFMFNSLISRIDTARRKCKRKVEWMLVSSSIKHLLLLLFSLFLIRSFEEYLTAKDPGFRTPPWYTGNNKYIHFLSSILYISNLYPFPILSITYRLSNILLLEHNRRTKIIIRIIFKTQIERKQNKNLNKN